MKVEFKVLSMCNTCDHHRHKSWEYDEHCSVSPNCRFAGELLPANLLEDKNAEMSVIACNEYKECDD